MVRQKNDICVTMRLVKTEEAKTYSTIKTISYTNKGECFVVCRVI